MFYIGAASGYFPLLESWVHCLAHLLVFLSRFDFSGVDGVMPEKEEVTGFWKFLFAVLIHAQISRSVFCGWGTLADSSHFCLYLLIYKMGQSHFCLCLKFVENII